MASLSDTFLAAVCSVATAATLASSGIYLHRRKLVTSEGKKALTTLSHQVAIPALFFTKIIYCPQDQRKDQCPNVIEHLPDVWILLLWPLYVVCCGLLVGEGVAILSGTPPSQRMMVRVACAFANSNALPITLLAVIHSNLAVANTGQVDPNLFLSVYLIVYPVVLWSLGTWLLSDKTSPTTDDEHVHHDAHREGLVGSNYFSLSTEVASTSHTVSELGHRHVATDFVRDRQGDAGTDEENASLLHRGHIELCKTTDREAAPTSALPLAQPPQICTETFKAGLLEALHPPAVGAVLGIFVASIRPLRGLFVDLYDGGGAPLQWLFNGLFAIGKAAVPLNMCILGINLSSAAQAKNTASASTVVAVVVGKMIIMPIIGILSTLVLKRYLLDIPDTISSPFYLVLMVVTITPTANGVMVMVELTRSSVEAMAKMIGWQYAVAPLILSISVMMIVNVAHG